MSTLTLQIRSWGEVKLDKTKLKGLMRTAANEVKKADIERVSRIAGSGRFYTYNGNRYQASAPGEPPVRRSGKMQASAKSYVYKSGEGFAVREREFYALFMETGAFPNGLLKKFQKKYGKKFTSKEIPNTYQRRMEKRPHLSAVMQEFSQPLMERVNKAMVQGLTWRQTR